LARIPLLRGCGCTALISPRRGGKRREPLAEEGAAGPHRPLFGEREGRGREDRENKYTNTNCGF